MYCIAGIRVRIVQDTVSPQTKAQRDAVVDDLKWSSAIAYVSAYNDYRKALERYDNDPFHPEVTKVYDTLLQVEARYKRMVKK